jgi:quinol monooxygenase YgiN
MIIGTVRILPPPDRHDEVIEVLRSVQGPVRAQPGCVACDVFDEQGPEPAVVLLERWETKEAFEHHLRSEAYRRVIAAVELSGARPEIRFEHVQSVEGLELVERLRNPDRTIIGG